jgi:predicted dinucleotide-binding enzyme
MKTITILGTGVVGQTIANKLILLGYHVVMGSRTADNTKGLAWVEVAGKNARLAAYADAVLASHIVFNCTKGALSAEILSSIGADQFAGKIVIDLANPLDFSAGFPPTLTLSNTDSLGETLQRNLPNAHIVKALNTMNCNIMVNPNLVANGDHDVFMCGNDAEAKAEVAVLLEAFGWQKQHIRDLGDITASRGLEQYLPFWAVVMKHIGHASFQTKIVQ